jgi:hypothetical protein
MSLLTQGNPDLDEYKSLIDRTPEGQYLIQTIDGHLYANYPPSLGLIAAPFVFVVEQIAQLAYSIDLATYLQNVVPLALESLIAGFFTALTVVLIYRIARLYLTVSYSLLLTFIFAFCTAAWSVTSRALWRHGPSMLLLTIALYLILLAKNKPRLIQFVSLPLAISFTIRGHNGISIALISLYVLLQYRSYFVRYLLWALPIAAAFAAYNFSLYHAPASPYYSVYQPLASSTLVEGALGTLFSPSRGLLIFSPVLLLAFLGVALKLKQRTFEKLDAILISIIILHWLVISDWRIWWGGWTFGSRFFADVLPYWIYLMIPAIAAIGTLRGPKKAALIAVAAVLAGFSFFVHYRGANVDKVMTEWHLYPANVDEHPERFWEWRDPQFLRGIKWGTPTTLGVAGVPVRQLDLDTYSLLGTNDIHTIKFNAGTSLISSPDQTWLAIADEQLIGPELSGLFANVTPVSNLRTTISNIPYRLYHFDLSDRLAQAAQQTEQRAWYSSELYPNPTASQPLDLPVRFGSNADLIGFQIITHSHSTNIALLTYWRAVDPLQAPIHLFVHAINTAGQIVAQDDRLDPPAKDWQPGDLFVQVSQLSLPPEAGPVWIEAGLYNPESGARLPVMHGEQEIDQRILLGEFTLP